MNGIHAAFTGILIKDAEVRAHVGRPYATFTAVVDDDAPGGVTVRVSVPNLVLGDLAPRLKKGVAFSVEGRLHLRFWVDEARRERTGLSLAAQKLELGRSP
jgi:hypothetical protein